MRVRLKEPPIQVPGPKKILPVDWEALWRDIGLLRHGGRRTAGTGMLWRRYSARISRRAFQEAVREYRLEEHRRKTAAMQRIEWRVPGAVWSMDDTGSKTRGYVHQVQDLASRYKFPPPAGDMLCGKEVAENLERMFKRYGPPLVLKRDNGGNVNHWSVEELLDRHLIIPLNSPLYYPRYNGGIERAQREVAEEVGQVSEHELIPAASRSQNAGLVVESLNHRPRPCLRGRTSCEVFCTGREGMKKYNRRRRREAIEAVYSMFLAELNLVRSVTRRTVNAAWRHAVEMWLLQEKIIAVSKPKSVTHLSVKSVS
jgi:transposase InsO family protein